jgi:hypothetical protein
VFLAFKSVPANVLISVDFTRNSSLSCFCYCVPNFLTKRLHSNTRILILFLIRDKLLPFKDCKIFCLMLLTLKWIVASIVSHVAGNFCAIREVCHSTEKIATQLCTISLSFYAAAKNAGFSNYKFCYFIFQSIFGITNYFLLTRYDRVFLLL